MKKGTKMTDEQKKHLSEAVKRSWDLKNQDLKYGSRESEDRTTYMRNYRREYYEKNKQKVLDYNLERIYTDLPTDKLLKMREKRLNSSFMPDDKRQRILNVIEKILIARGALTVECDFKHNYTTKTIEDWDMCNVAPPKPTRIEIDGVWYDLVEHKGVTVSG